MINYIYEDKQGNIWVCARSGLYLLSTENPFTCIFISSFDAAVGVNTYVIHTIYQDHDSIYWIGTSEGLIRMQKKGDRFVYQKEANQINNLNNPNITAISEDLSHQLWVGTLHGGIYLYDPVKGVFTGFLNYNKINDPINNNIRVLTRDRAGKIWIGTQWGISILDPSTQKFTSYRHDADDKKSLSQNSVYSIYIDKNNSAWIGTYFGGVNMASNYITDFQTAQYHAIINNNVVSAISEDKDHNLWIGTEGAGLSYYNKETHVIKSYQNNLRDPLSIGSNLIKAIYIDKSGNTWVGTHGGGLNLFEPASQNFRRYLYKENDRSALNSEVTSFLEDSKNNFWVGTDKGLLLFKRNSTFLQQINSPFIKAIGGKAIATIFEDNNKNVWIGADDGLYKLDSHLTKISKYGDTNGLNVATVQCIYQDSNGTIWVGIYNGGLAMYLPHKKSFITYTDQDGLANNDVVGILEDDNKNLWISTGNGLSKFNIRSHLFKNYSKTDGLGANTFNINSCYKTAEGEMLFGGLYGLTNFFPSKIIVNNIPPPIIFTSLKLGGQPVAINGADKLLTKDISFTDHLVFSNSQNVFTIEFAALNYIKSAKNKYAYKLAGFDKNWVSTNIPSATYTNLPPGTYTFSAKGTNNDGIWSKVAVLTIKVLPPFWKTFWAYGLYSLFICGILFLIIRFFILRSLLKRDKELTQLKLNFFTNISHEIRTHLSLIAGPVEKLILEEKEQQFPNKQLQIIKKNSNSLLQLVTELMDFRKAEAGHVKLHLVEDDIVGFLNEIYLSFHHDFSSKNIGTDFQSSTGHILLYFDKEQLEKVFFNLIYNACKYTDDYGFIKIGIEEKKDSVEIIITDNGRGIAPHNLNNLFENYFQENDHGKQNTGYGIGLALAKSIVDLHKGLIKVESFSSVEGNKTSFSVILKKGLHHFKQQQPVNKPNNPALSHKPHQNDEIIGTPNNSAGMYKGRETFSHTILLIEDNADLRLFIAEHLQQQFNIVECANGQEGWNRATELIPDIIISDIMMPEMDGITLCNHLKADERTNHIPVILLTAKSSTDNQVEGLTTGATIYITKPFSIEVLALQISNLLLLREKIHERFYNQIRYPAPLVKGSSSNLQNDEKLSSTILSSPIEDAFLQKIVNLIVLHIDSPELNVPFLSREMGMSQPVLYKKLNALSGSSVNDLIKFIRLNKAMELLQEKDKTVYEIAYMVGFSDRKYFSKEFKKLFGKAPNEYRGEQYLN
ncbi:MAG: two-component regulator propeller domain-containing protein [Bacteroidota bacterium]